LNPDEITVFDPQQKHYYQPGFTNISGGVWNKRMADKYTSRNMADVLQSGLNFVNHGVKTIDADNNSLTTTSGREFTYDYLVVSSGV
jgi:sulfide:quinone oxidoreductase